MSDKPRISFHIIPGPKGLEKAKARLKELGFDKVLAGGGDKRLRVSAPRELIEKIFKLSLQAKSRRIRIGPVMQTETDFQLPEKAKLPKALQDVIGRVIFPKRPDYH